jgi:hypothetical protein
MDRPPSAAIDPRRIGKALLFVAAACLLAAHLLALSRENVNWDEFALLSRAQESLATGRLVGDGRPGLGTLVLIPFVRGCTNAVDAVVAARSLWALFLLAYAGGLFVLVRQAARGAASRPSTGAVLAVALVALVPTFQRWGLQVRTDQPALALGLWGGVALLASARRPVWALATGAAWGVGFLFSQKVVYPALLSSLLALSCQLRAGPLLARREASRAALLVAAAGACVLAFRAATSGPAAGGTLGVESSLGSNAFYGTFGYRTYLGMLNLLVPHLLLLLLLVAATAASLARTRRLPAQLWLGWAVVAAGAAVVVLHGSRFPYFWMTLGLFPAVAAGLTLERLLEPLPVRLRGLVLPVTFVLLLLKAGPAALEVTRDTQAHQREALEFVGRNFDATARGFHPERALLCRADPKPFQIYFSEAILRRFVGPRGEEQLQAFVGEFRSRPVRFIVESYRLDQFPDPVLRFWEEAYAFYAASVAVPGRRIDGARGERLRFEAVVDGPFRLHLPPGSAADHVLVDGAPLRDGGSVQLARGAHTLQLVGAVRGGLLALALEEPPDLSRVAPFYHPDAVREMRGQLRW